MVVMNLLTSLRQFRIGSFAIFDTVLGFFGMYLLAPLLSKLFAKLHLDIPKSSWLWWMFPISVVFHLIFRQDTPLMRVFSSTQGLLIASATLAFMIFMGARGCRRN